LLILVIIYNLKPLHLPPWGKAGKGVLERTETISPSPLGEGREGGPGKNKNQLHLPPWGKAGKGVLERTKINFTFPPGGRQGRGSWKERKPLHLPPWGKAGKGVLKKIRSPVARYSLFTGSISKCSYFIQKA